MPPRATRPFSRGEPPRRTATKVPTTGSVLPSRSYSTPLLTPVTGGPRLYATGHSVDASVCIRSRGLRFDMYGSNHAASEPLFRSPFGILSQAWSKPLFVETLTMLASNLPFIICEFPRLPTTDVIIHEVDVEYDILTFACPTRETFPSVRFFFERTNSTQIHEASLFAADR